MKHSVHKAKTKLKVKTSQKKQVFETSYLLIREQILKKIKPTKKEEEKTYSVAIDCADRIRESLYKKGISVDVILGGSVAKGTWLKATYDIDFFVRFKKNIDLSALDAFATKVKGSRDYYQFSHKGYAIEAVPVLEIRSYQDAKNVTDVSPLHVVYASSKLSDAQKDDVRLAKQFCKATKVYGAESYINGFSGHVLELLIMHYGSFQKLIFAATKWSKQVVIDQESHHKNPLQALNAAKIESPIILIDPVQPNRNAAAALSYDSFSRFIFAAKEFVQSPSTNAFVQKPLTKTAIKKRTSSHSTVIFELYSLPEKRDTAGTKCLKAFEYIASHLEGFTLVDSGFEYTHNKGLALTYVCVKEKLLPEFFEREGPPLSAKKAAENFRELHKHVRIRNNRLYVDVKRKYRTLKSLVVALSKESPVQTRVSKIIIE